MFGHLKISKRFNSLRWFYGVLILKLFITSPLEAEETSKDKLEVAFIYQFTSYIEWPTPGKNKFQISTLGTAANTSLSADSWNELSTKLIKGQPIEIHLDAKTDIARKSQIVLFETKDTSELKQMIKHFAGSGALTISEGEGFGELGVMINFFYEDNRLRFEINRGACEKEKIKVGPQLLKLAKIVE
ncbi:MAG: hypothetical protein JWQ35_1284 [Bacteriovoracaceae bacterium]|nr:hypothetical protein [Bacteriovoracaceae bacterium]